MGTAKGQGSIGLYCKLYPQSSTAASRVLELLGQTYPYYRTEKSQCTAWCYVTRSEGDGILPQSKKPPGEDVPRILGIEFYTEKNALSTQLADEQYFQKYHKMVQKEDLYAKPEELMACYPAAGFLTRGSGSVEHEGGMRVILAEMTFRDENAKKSASNIIKEFADWVFDNEPDTLAYCFMTKSKAPLDILVFERYRNADGLKRHAKSKKMVEFFSPKFFPLLRSGSIVEGSEVKGSFVQPLSSDVQATKANL